MGRFPHVRAFATTIYKVIFTKTISGMYGTTGLGLCGTAHGQNRSLRLVQGYTGGAVAADCTYEMKDRRAFVLPLLEDRKRIKSRIVASFGNL